jgi:hypothetical protein
MRKKWNALLMVALAMMMVFAGNAFAFQDLPHGEQKDKILALKDQGIVHGLNEREFAPGQKITLAQGVSLIVKGMKLNIDHIRFIKEPKASDYFTKVPDGAWYAEAIIIANLNGLDIPGDADPHAVMTREQFTHMLFKAMSTKGEYAFIELWIMIADEDEITPEYMNSIQKMLIAKIVSLDEQRKFHPKKQMTRAEAAITLHDALKFVKEQQSTTPPSVMPERPADDGVPAEKPIGGPREDKPVTPGDDAQMSVEAVNEEVNKIIFTWGVKPNSGYSITVDRIEFDHRNMKATIYYTLHEPEPDKMYLQVITEPRAETYVSTKYQPTAVKSEKGTVEPSSQSISYEMQIAN